MLTHKLFRKSLTYKMSKWMQGLLVLIFAVSLVGVQPVKPVEAAVDTVTEWANPSSGSTGPYTITDSIFSCESGLDRLLVAVVTSEVSTTAVSNITVTKGSGVNFTQAITTSTANKVQVWIGFLIESQITGNTNDIVITNNGTAWTGSDVYLACYSGVNQAQPIITDGIWYSQGTNVATSTPSFSIPVINGGTIVYGNARAQANASTVTISDAVPSSPAWIKYFERTGTGYNMTVAEKQVSADSTPVTTTFTWPSQVSYADAAISINPAAALNTTSAGIATALSTGLDSIEVSMPYGDDANSNNTYSVDYKLSSDTEWTNWVTDSVHEASPYITTITGLSPATSYDIQMTYQDPDGVTGENPQTDAGVSTYYTLTVDSGTNGTVTLDPTGGSYAPGTEVTLTAVANSGYAFNSWSGDLTGNENPATITMDGDKNISADFVTAPFVVELQDGLNGYAGSRDTYIYDVSPDTIRGTETTFVQDKNTGDERRSLLLFDLSSIPEDAIISSAELQFYVSAEGQGFNIFRMYQPWDEAITFTSNGGHFDADDIDAESTVNANWPGDDGYTGYITVTVTPETIQDWIDGTLVNNGWLMIATDVDDGQQLRSREYATQAERPKLTVKYYMPTGDPTIIILGTPLQDFSGQPGIPSEEQSYTVSGNDLSEDIEIIAPDDFEISLTSGSGFGTTLTLTPDVDGNVPITPIYVRFNPGTEGNFSGDISHVSVDATTLNVAISGTATIVPTVVVFQDGLNGYGGTRDTYIFNTTPSDPRGEETTFVQDYDSESVERRSLLSFDLSSIPVGATITSAEFEFYVTNEGKGFNFYPMLVPWDEATVSYESIGSRHFEANGVDAEEAVDITWSQDGATGFNSVSIPISTVQDWIDGVLPNYGWLGIATDNPDGDGQQLASRENGTQERNPKLTVEYVVYPHITISGILNEFHTLPGVASAPQTYTVAGTGLYEDISITAPVGFEIKTESGSYDSSLNLIPSDGVVVPTTIYVRLNNLSEGTFSGDIVHSSAGAPSQNMLVTGTISDLSPNDPVLVQPADDAEGISTSPTLEVTVSDPDSNFVDVSYYGRPVGGGADDFTLVVLPDTQKYTPPSTYTATFSALTQWIADQESEQNIVFVTHVGDIVEDNREDGWVVADNAFDILDAGNVPYSVGVGNNDFTGTDYSLFESYFGISRFENRSWYGGHYGSNNVNNYSLFSASGMDFILINLNFDPSTAELDWADGLLTTYSDRRAIVESHNQLNLDDSWSNSDVYDALKDHENLFLLLSGHLSNATDGVAKRTDLGDQGQSIYSVLQDYQNYTDANNGYLHIYRFSPTDDKICMTVYSPTLETYNSAADSNLEFTYVMPDEADFDLIDVDEDVPSGSNASVLWDELTETTEYEWYAVVNDGTTTTASSVWSFTTGTGPNNVPVLDPIGSKTVNENETLTFTATATDEDLPLQMLSFRLVGSPTGASMTAGGEFNWTPTEEQGPGEYTFTVKVCDDASTPLCDEEEITVTVNEVNVAPSISEGETYSVTMSENSTPTAFSLTLHAADSDSPTNTLTWSVSSEASHGVATASGTGESPALDYVPETDYIGEDSFEVQVSDGVGGTDTIVVNVSIEMDLAYALTMVQEQTTISGTLDALTVQFPVEIPQVVVDEGYYINSRMTLGAALPEGSLVTIERDGVIVAADLTLTGVGPFWFTELLGGTLANSAPFNHGYDDASEHYVITISGNHEAINTTLTIESVISTDLTAFDDEVVLASHTVDVIQPMDLGYALTLVQDQTTLTGTLDNLTATFPVEIPQVVVDEGYSINSRMTLADPLPAGSTVTITIKVNGVGPVPYVTDVPVPGQEFWVTELFDPDSEAAAFDAGYSGRIEIYAIAINSPNAFSTSVKIESIISKDEFATDVILADITLPVSGLAHSSIDLVAGWNLVSFPIHPESTDIADVLADIAGKYNLVYAWDASGASSSSGNWKKYDPSVPFGNTLTMLDEKVAFWIFMTEAAALEVQGSHEEASTVNLLDDAGGWNLVGYPSASSMDLPAAMGSVTYYTLIFSYRAADSGDPWKLFDPTAGSWANDLKQMAPGWGYWIFVTSDVGWQVDY